MYTGVKSPCDASQGTPSRPARNFAAASRLWDGTITWSSPMVMESPPRARRRLASSARCAGPSSPGKAQEIVAETAIAVAHVDDSHHEAPVAGVNTVGAGRVTPSIKVPEGRVGAAR